MWQVKGTKNTLEGTPSTWVCSQQRSCMRNQPSLTEMTCTSQLHLQKHTCSGNDPKGTNSGRLKLSRFTMHLIIHTKEYIGAYAYSTYASYCIL